MTSQPFLEICNLCKTFGGIKALDDVSFSVAEDELLVVLGPTGAGKTTLLRALVGLEQPDSGSITRRGEDLARMSPAERDMSLVFQNFSLYPDWSVRKNLEFPLRAPGRRESSADIRERVSTVCGMLKITHLLERKANRLSGGEMQRVTIGRAIVRRPQLFLMDEPLTNLDAKLREELRVELAVLRRQLKTPMIYVTHDQAEALSMADRILVLAEGRILQTGSPREIYEQPISPVVARQLGQPAINIFQAHHDHRSLLTADGTVIATGLSKGAAPTCVVGIRPENIAIRGGATPATVEVVEDMGASKIILARWGDQHLHAIVGKDCTVRSGDQIFPIADSTRIVIWEEGALARASRP
ncbi:MAG: ABC transporter ATP-binding protein [Verrucomicrobia bacterium]|nr:ABC transporter ATP-binding protein [Verrucomicrobiota bacterium]MDA1087263.1 ABC transporter ATP-binding protein [Verrucomicrobiota bacterium]